MLDCSYNVILPLSIQCLKMIRHNNIGPHYGEKHVHVAYETDFMYQGNDVL